MKIALVNQSKRLTNPQDLRELAVACNRQLAGHVAPLWHRISFPVTLHADPSTVDANSWPIVIVDNPTQAGALGYHTEDPARTPGGLPVIHGFVFVDPVLDNAGTVLDGENSVSGVASHEIAEMFIDPNCQGWMDDQNGVAYAFEIADPCENDAYEIIGLTRQVSVSNFVLPSWFDAMTPKGQPVDYLKKLPGPFACDAGGYYSYLSEGQPQQFFGRQMAPWKQDAHHLPGSRMVRRKARRAA